VPEMAPTRSSDAWASQSRTRARTRFGGMEVSTWCVTATIRAKRPEGRHHQRSTTPTWSLLRKLDEGDPTPQEQGLEQAIVSRQAERKVLTLVLTGAEGLVQFEKPFARWAIHSSRRGSCSSTKCASVAIELLGETEENGSGGRGRESARSTFAAAEDRRPWCRCARSDRGVVAVERHAKVPRLVGARRVVSSS